MEEKQELMTADSICNRVYTIRGQQVMLDYDLAELYGYEVKRLNEQVKRNINRFPEDFMFQLTKTETEKICLKSQFATLNDIENKFSSCESENLKSQIATSSWGGKRKLPYAFTEQGIYMLATVLKGELAEQQSIFIMLAFREMRHYIKQNQQFVTQAEIQIVTAKVSEMYAQMLGFSDRQSKTEQDVKNIQKSIDAINENFISDKEFKNYVIYKGQKFEADAAYIDIYQQATASIYVIDDYMSTKTLQLLSQKKQGIEVVLFTENGHGRNGFLTRVVVNDFKNQYPPLRIKPNPDCHDRWVVLDYGMHGEQAYHCGASSKDAGKKLCAINKMENTEILHSVIDRLLSGEDKEI